MLQVRNLTKERSEVARCMDLPIFLEDVIVRSREHITRPVFVHNQHTQNSIRWRFADGGILRRKDLPVIVVDFPLVHTLALNSRNRSVESVIAANSPLERNCSTVVGVEEISLCCQEAISVEPCSNLTRKLIVSVLSFANRYSTAIGS